MELIRQYYSKIHRQILVTMVAGGGALVSTLVTSSFMKFYTDIIGLRPSIYAAIFLVFSIWNGINDPIIGLWSDKAAFIKGKGKYKRLIIKAIPLLALPVIALLFAQPSWNQAFMAAYLLILMVIYEGAQTLLNVSFNAFKINTFISSGDRTKIQTINTYVNQIPVFAAGAIPMIFLTGEFSRTTIVAVYTAAIVLGVILIIIGSIYIKEDASFYEKLEVAHGLKELWSFFKQFLTSKSFVMFIIAMFFINVATGNYFVGYLYYMDNVLLVEGAKVVVPDVLTGIGQMLLLPFIVIWTRKYGVRNTWAYGLLLSVAGHAALSFNIGYWIAAPVYILILLGYAFSSACTIPLSGLVIDDLEIQTGKRQPGIVGGIIAVFAIPAASVQVLLLGTILDITGYDGAIKEQSAEVVKAIRIGVGIIPAIILLIGILVMLKFPFGKKDEKILHDKIVEKHAMNEELEA